MEPWVGCYVAAGKTRLRRQHAPRPHKSSISDGSESDAAGGESELIASRECVTCGDAFFDPHGWPHGGASAPEASLSSSALAGPNATPMRIAVERAGASDPVLSPRAVLEDAANFVVRKLSARANVFTTCHGGTGTGKTRLLFGAAVDGSAAYITDAPDALVPMVAARLFASAALQQQQQRVVGVRVAEVRCVAAGRFEVVDLLSASLVHGGGSSRRRSGSTSPDSFLSACEQCGAATPAELAALLARALSRSASWRAADLDLRAATAPACGPIMLRPCCGADPDEHPGASSVLLEISSASGSHWRVLDPIGPLPGPFDVTPRAREARLQHQVLLSRLAAAGDEWGTEGADECWSDGSGGAAAVVDGKLHEGGGAAGLLVADVILQQLHSGSATQWIATVRSDAEMDTVNAGALQIATAVQQTCVELQLQGQLAEEEEEVEGGKAPGGRLSRGRGGHFRGGRSADGAALAAELTEMLLRSSGGHVGRAIAPPGDPDPQAVSLGGTSPSDPLIADGTLTPLSSAALETCSTAPSRNMHDLSLMEAEGGRLGEEGGHEEPGAGDSLTSIAATSDGAHSGLHVQRRRAANDLRPSAGPTHGQSAATLREPFAPSSLDSSSVYHLPQQPRPLRQRTAPRSSGSGSGSSTAAREEGSSEISRVLARCLAVTDDDEDKEDEDECVVDVASEGGAGEPVPQRAPSLLAEEPQPQPQPRADRAEMRVEAVRLREAADAERVLLVAQKQQQQQQLNGKGERACEQQDDPAAAQRRFLIQQQLEIMNAEATEVAEERAKRRARRLQVGRKASGERYAQPQRQVPAPAAVTVARGGGEGWSGYSTRPVALQNSREVTVSGKEQQGDSEAAGRLPSGAAVATEKSASRDCSTSHTTAGDGGDPFDGSDLPSVVAAPSSAPRSTAATPTAMAVSAAALPPPNVKADERSRVSPHNSTAITLQELVEPLLQQHETAMASLIGDMAARHEADRAVIAALAAAAAAPAPTPAATTVASSRSTSASAAPPTTRAAAASSLRPRGDDVVIGAKQLATLKSQLARRHAECAELRAEVAQLRAHGCETKTVREILNRAGRAYAQLQTQLHRFEAAEEKERGHAAGLEKTLAAERNRSTALAGRVAQLEAWAAELAADNERLARLQSRAEAESRVLSVFNRAGGQKTAAPAMMSHAPATATAAHNDPERPSPFRLAVPPLSSDVSAADISAPPWRPQPFGLNDALHAAFERASTAAHQPLLEALATLEELSRRDRKAADAAQLLRLRQGALTAALDALRGELASTEGEVVDAAVRERQYLNVILGSGGAKGGHSSSATPGATKPRPKLKPPFTLIGSAASVRLRR